MAVLHRSLSQMPEAASRNPLAYTLPDPDNSYLAARCPQISTPLPSSEALERALEAVLHTEATANPWRSRTLRIFLASSIFGNAITMLLIPVSLLLQTSYVSPTRPHAYRRYRYSAISQSVTCLVYLSHSFFLAVIY